MKPILSSSYLLKNGLKTIISASILLILLIPTLSQANNFNYLVKPLHSDQEVLDIEAKPGTTIKYNFEIINIGSKELNLQLYPTDATLSQQGERSYRGQEQAMQKFGKWTTIDQSLLKIPIGQSRFVELTTNIPNNISGQIVGGLAAQNTNSKSSGAINLQFRRTSKITINLSENPTPPTKKPPNFNLNKFYFYFSIAFSSIFILLGLRYLLKNS